MACTHEETDRTDGRRLTAALAVISVFMVVEVIGGLIASSLALLADAAHMFTDAVSLALAASAQWFSQRPPDGRRHFGYQRGQVLAAFVNGVLLFVLIGWIVFEAFHRFANPADVAWRPMLIVAVLGLGANALAFRILHASAARNVNVRGALLHVVGDLFGSVAAVAAALAISVGAGAWIDPLLSLAVAGLIAWSARKLLLETGHILLQGAPAEIDVEALRLRIEGLSESILDVHGVQIWQMRPGDARIVMHARVDDEASTQEVLALIKAELASSYGVVDSTVQVEVGACCEIDVAIVREAMTARRSASDLPVARATSDRAEKKGASAGETVV